jgi:hypothetical protein
MKLDTMLIRSGKPSQYDQSPYGTLCKRVKAMSDVFENYIQMSKNDCYPCWEKVGIFTPDTECLIVEEVNRLLRIKEVS